MNTENEDIVELSQEAMAENQGGGVLCFLAGFTMVVSIYLAVTSSANNDDIKKKRAALSAA